MLSVIFHYFLTNSLAGLSINIPLFHNSVTFTAKSINQLFFPMTVHRSITWGLKVILLGEVKNRSCREIKQKKKKKDDCMKIKTAFWCTFCYSSSSINEKSSSCLSGQKHGVKYGLSFQFLLHLISVLSLFLPPFAFLFSNRMRCVNAWRKDCSHTLGLLGDADAAQYQNSLESRKIFQRKCH